MPLQQTSGNATSDAYGGGAAAVANYIEDVFSTYLYTGTGSGASQTITNGIDLSTKGGLVWVKCRGSTFNNALVDTVRGADQTLFSDATAINQDYSASGTVNTFSTTGFTVGTNNTTNANAASGGTFASWTFRKQPKFFDIVTYTGTGANRTISHNLGSVPGCIIVKRTDAVASWQVYHSSLANTQYMLLNGTSAAATGATRWNSTTPTSSVFSVGTDTSVNASGGTYVAYLFASNAGGFGLTGSDNVISCGSYTGNGISIPGGPVITLGWEPQFILIKNSSSGFDWLVVDNMRGMADNSAGTPTAILAPNSTASETQSQRAAPTATGFQITSNAGIVNNNGDVYIYIAIRRGPMKVPTVGTSVFNIDTFTGTNAVTTRSGYAFSPDMTISRNTGSASISNNFLLDRLRGWTGANQATISTNATSAEVASSDRPDGTVVSNGIQLYGYSAGNNWFLYFRRAPGFFDEVCWTGPGTGAAVNHNLGVVPELVIQKLRSGGAGFSAWYVQNNINLSSKQDGYLNTSAAFSVSAATSPTSTVFYPTDDQSGAAYVTYLFATCPGVSKVGSYSGTGATQTINCGFTGGARFVLIKRTDTTGDWYVWDTARGMVAGTDPSLLLNSTAVQVNANSVYTTGVGFQIVSTAAGINASGGTYIFLAVA